MIKTHSGGISIRIVVIGGTGLPSLGDGSSFAAHGITCMNSDELSVSTEYGMVPFTVQDYVYKGNNSKLFFLNRHHSIAGKSNPPHMINHRANILAVESCKPDIVISICSVGAVDLDFIPGMVGLVNQYVDFTGKVSTFFDGDAIHTSVTNPFDADLNNRLVEVLKSSQGEFYGFENSRYFQTYWMMSGPQYETPAEISAIRKLGGTCVGMTLTSEAKLLAEKEMKFTAICISSNWAAGADQLNPHADLSHEEISRKALDKLESVWKCIASLLTDR